ncbi:unnamed protein product [Orchesella dallaii]|uniref:Uncharacterized protein n=1 Tax=Orchesella dallaii TaxID=48710 RepID=A0ABP1PY16_9HEXA
MELHVEAMRHCIAHELCGENDDICSMQGVSIDDFEEDINDRDNNLDSEAEDTDYDAIEDEDESEAEEEEDENSDDDSQLHALIDDLELKFRMLVSSKIGEVEQFFDDANTLQQHVSHSTLADSRKKCDQSVTVENYTQQESQDKDTARNSKSLAECSSSKVQVQMYDMGTQTDEDIVCQASVKTINCAPEVSNNTPVTLTSLSDKARIEISQLRDVRDSLISQRQQWATQLKQCKDENNAETKKAEAKMYELEEAVEALDTAIEFKNEIVLGQPQTKVTESISPGTSEADLVTRLETLSLEELQRLLCKYFAKVVELRTSSRRLEKHLEHAENSNEKLRERLVGEHKLLKEMHLDYQSRIRLIFSGNNPNAALDSYLRKMDEQLAAARKKQHDLERSLTELLVRHGYLVNGADYDVKQVVKMLGIESQLAGTTHRAQDGGAGAEGSAQPSHTRGLEAPGPSAWHKGTKSRFAGLGHRRNGRQLDGHELQRIHRDVRLVEGWDREREREHRPLVQPAQPTEVRREKRRIIIQPSNGVPSSTQPHHGSPNHHYQHPHQPGHGSHQYGYK